MLISEVLELQLEFWLNLLRQGLIRKLDKSEGKPDMEETDANFATKNDNFHLAFALTCSIPLYTRILAFPCSY